MERRKEDFEIYFWNAHKLSNFKCSQIQEEVHRKVSYLNKMLLDAIC